MLLFLSFSFFFSFSTLFSSNFFYSFFSFVHFQDGDTALMCACVKGHFNIVELLLKHQADVNMKSNVSVGGKIGMEEGVV